MWSFLSLSLWAGSLEVRLLTVSSCCSPPQKMLRGLGSPAPCPRPHPWSRAGSKPNEATAFLSHSCTRLRELEIWGSCGTPGLLSSFYATNNLWLTVLQGRFGFLRKVIKGPRWSHLAAKQDWFSTGRETWRSPRWGLALPLRQNPLSLGTRCCARFPADPAWPSAGWTSEDKASSALWSWSKPPPLLISFLGLPVDASECSHRVSSVWRMSTSNPPLGQFCPCHSGSFPSLPAAVSGLWDLYNPTS